MKHTKENGPGATLRLRITAVLTVLIALGQFASQSSLAADRQFKTLEIADLDNPWAMAVLPDGRLLVTEKVGNLLLIDGDGAIRTVGGVPDVAFGGQGGLGDVVLHPDFASNQLVYLSFAEAGEGGYGAVVGRAKLELNDADATLEGLEVIWRQAPKVEGQGHYGHRIAFGPDGYLWISSGERQKFDPAQDMQSNMGKILRLRDDGSIPADNPFADQGGVTAQIWSLGHRNPLGMAFDRHGRLWVAEMGPKDGDELNLVERSANYGYPIVSNGDHYDGREIPDHDQRPDMQAPAITWTPVISPASLMFYSGSRFPDWQGSALIAGLSSKGLVRVEFDGEKAIEAERIPMGARIRDVKQGADGSIWVLEDDRKDSKGRLLRLTHDFHDTALGNGSLPVAVLEELVNEWIDERRG
jgi:glucose/arabinose dehydrogenase